MPRVRHREWTPFERAFVPKREIDFANKTFGTNFSPDDVGECWRNNVYQVEIRRQKPEDETLPDLLWLSIRRIDRNPVRDWRHFQRIKNELVGSECEGLELYPAESRLVDAANQYHLFVFDSPTFRFPFGFNERLVSSDSPGKTRQRPHRKSQTER